MSTIAKASEHIKPCNIAQSERHNRRDADYIASLNPSMLYIRQDLACQNATYVAPDMVGVSLQQHYDNIKVMVKQKTGRAMQEKDVEDAIAKYNEEQGRAQREAYYTCFDIMQKFGLGKTQVRRFAEIHGVRIKKAKGGRANLYLKADWDAARKKAEAKRKYTKTQREGL